MPIGGGWAGREPEDSSCPVRDRIRANLQTIGPTRGIGGRPPAFGACRRAWPLHRHALPGQLNVLSVRRVRESPDRAKSLAGLARDVRAKVALTRPTWPSTALLATSDAPAGFPNCHRFPGSNPGAASNFVQRPPRRPAIPGALRVRSGALHDARVTSSSTSPRDSARPRPGRWAPRIVSLAILLLAGGLRVANFDVPDRSPDEQLWTKFGAHIAREGPAWVTRLVHDFNRGADVDFPWQQRIGYTCLVGLVMCASGDTTVRAVEAISTVSSLATIAITGVVAREFLGPWTAVVAMLFLAVSPLDLALARRAWQDDVIALLTLLAAWAFLRHASGGGRLSRASFFAVAGFTLLVKESAAIAFGLGTLGLAWTAWRGSRDWRPPVGVLAWGAATALGAFAVVVAVSGGWAELHRTLDLSREALAPDDYLRHYQTGGPDYYVTGLRILQPVPFLLGALGAVLAVFRAPFLAPEGRPAHARAALAALGALALGFGAVAFGYYSKNMRFLSPIYAPTFLLAAALIAAGVSYVRAHAPRAAAIAVVAAVALGLAASAVLDVRRFDHWFNELEMQDLATPWFTQPVDDS